MERQSGGSKEHNQNLEKLKALMPYWVRHESQHIQDEGKWLAVAESMGLESVASELKEAIRISREANRHMELAYEKLQEGGMPETVEAPKEEKIWRAPAEAAQAQEEMHFEINRIGFIRTPYIDDAPYQPLEDSEGEFRIVLDPRYESGLHKLSTFRYIYVIYYVHQVDRQTSMTVSPPWTGGEEVGVFASRSPVRPNCIGISVVRIKNIKRNEIYTSGLDAFDGTPVLDIKPYIKDLDAKDDANYGWIEDMHDYEHLLLHIKGIPHEY